VALHPALEFSRWEADGALYAQVRDDFQIRVSVPSFDVNLEPGFDFAGGHECVPYFAAFLIARSNRRCVSVFARRLGWGRTKDAFEEQEFQALLVGIRQEFVSVKEPEVRSCEADELL